MTGTRWMRLAIALFALVLAFGCVGTSVDGATQARMAANGTIQTQILNYSSGAFRVGARLCVPSHIDNRTVAVVLTGGDGVTLSALRPVCEAFASEGLVALAHENVNGTLGDDVGAVAGALDYLQSRYPAMPRALWAHSAGTIFSVLAAYERPDIAAFVDTSGHMQIPLCDKPGAAPPVGDKCWAYLQDFPAPILVVHGLNDSTVPVDFAYAFTSRLQALGKTHGLLIVPGGVHEFLTDRPAVLQEEAAFIRHEPYQSAN